MNCLEFRRISLSEPGNRAQDYLGHRNQCEDCARYAKSVNDLDKKIENALRVPVPDDLAARIKLRQVLLAEQDNRMTEWLRPWRFGLAASLLLVVTLGGLFGYEVHATNQYVERLTVSAVDHTRIERQGNHFVAEHADPAKQMLRFKQVLAAFGGNVMEDELAAIGEILHIQVCALGPTYGPVAHAVIRGQQGAVTIYYVFGRKAGSRKQFERGRFDGMLLSVGNGNFTIIGNRGERLSSIADTLEQAIVWKI